MGPNVVNQRPEKFAMDFFSTASANHPASLKDNIGLRDVKV
jgi:hypothetical protein